MSIHSIQYMGLSYSDPINYLLEFFQKMIIILIYTWFVPISLCNLTMVFLGGFSLRSEPRRKRNLIDSNQGQDLTGFSARCLSGHMVFDSVASLGDRKRDAKNEPWKIMENTKGETTHVWCIIYIYIYMCVCVRMCVCVSVIYIYKCVFIIIPHVCYI